MGHANRLMKPLQKAVMMPDQLDRAIEDIGKSYDQHPEATCNLAGLPTGSSREAVLLAARQQTLAEMVDSTIWLNDVYQVHRKEMEDVVWLSIRRLDRQPCRDWRDLQAIKNQLVGPECEGCELYPAESRLVDSANQFHLWVVKDPEFRFPFGFAGRRAVMPPTEGTHAKQR